MVSVEIKCVWLCLRGNRANGTQVGSDSSSTRLETKLLEEVSDSSLVSLLGDIVLVQVPAYHTTRTPPTRSGRSSTLSSELPFSPQASCHPWSDQQDRSPRCNYRVKRRAWNKPSGHEVLEVQNLREHLHRGSLLHFLLRHAGENLARTSLESANDSVGELVLRVSLLIHLHDESLLSGVLARENDYDLSSLKKLGHLFKPLEKSI